MGMDFDVEEKELTESGNNKLNSATATAKFEERNVGDSSGRLYPEDSGKVISFPNKNEEVPVPGVPGVKKILNDFVFNDPRPPMTPQEEEAFQMQLGEGLDLEDE